MSDRDLFIAMLLASISSGSGDPLSRALGAFEAFKTLDNKGALPK